MREREFFYSFLKAKLLYNLGWSVRPKLLALFVYLDMLELSYRFQTCHNDSYNSLVRLKKHSKSIIVTRKSVRPFKHADFLLFRQQIFVCYNYSIHLSFGILIPITTRYNVISEAFL